MIAKDWIVNKIKDLALLMPQLKVRYENHLISSTHFLEVVPNSIFYLNEQYKTWEEEVTFKFIENFPNQNICFISNDAIVGLEHIDFEITGSLFDLYYSENINSYHLVDKVNFVNSEFEIFHESPVVTENSQVILTDLSSLSLQYSFDYLVQPPPLAFQEIIKKSLIENVGENTYALAA